MREDGRRPSDPFRRGAERAEELSSDLMIVQTMASMSIRQYVG